MRGGGVFVATITGVIVGLGSYTFRYAEGLSYFSTNPQACANCHIMNDEYASWQQAGHHQAATCVECHLPHEFVPKYLAKAENGWRHSKAFTLQDFHEPIQITRLSANDLQDSCIRCHSDFVHELVAGARAVSDEAARCVHCHRGVGHGARN